MVPFNLKSFVSNSDSKINIYWIRHCTFYNMIAQSLLLLFLVATITLIAIIISQFLYRKIPPKEMGLIVLCLISEFFSFIFYSVNNVYSTPTNIHTDSLVFSGIGYFLAILAILLLTYSIILIDFKYTYRDIFRLILLTFIGGINSIYNAVRFSAKLYNGAVEIEYDSLGTLFIILFFSIVLTIWVRRIRQISKIYKLQNQYDDLIKSLSYFVIIAGIFIAIYISLIIFDYTGDFGFIMSGMITTIGIVTLLRNNAFLFITDVHLESIIIVEKQSGIRLYSRSFGNNSNDLADDSDFIGSVVSAINISLSSTIRSQKDLTELSFADKTVLIYTGAYVRSILIVSSTNLIGKSISEYLVKRFEKSFGELIKDSLFENGNLGRQKNYAKFNSVVEYVRTFLPL